MHYSPHVTIESMIIETTILIIILIGSVAALIWLISNFTSALQSSTGGAYFVPLEEEVSNKMMELADIKPGEMVYDLGCGDARNLITAVMRYGAQGYGIEVAILPYFRGRQQVKLLGLEDKITIRQDNFFNVNLGGADVIVLNLSTKLNNKLLAKIKAECKPGTRILSARFPFSHLEPEMVDNSTIYPIFRYLI